MPDLDFRITGVEPAARGIVPLIHFKLAVSNPLSDETVHAVILQAQVQIQSPQRSYQAREKEKLLDLFGTPDQWGQTLRNRLWTHVHASIPSFTGHTETYLSIPCTYDLNVAATKYFYALEEGDIPLLFLFTGTIFYATPEGRLQVQRISWDKECTYRMPVRTWRELMDHHYPQSAWLSLHSDVFERLYRYKCLYGLPTWEATLERLLANDTLNHPPKDRPERQE